ncbi:MAG: hypothetical protein R3C62_24475 [Chloroflexota bacterium]
MEIETAVFAPQYPSILVTTAQNTKTHSLPDGTTPLHVTFAGEKRQNNYTGQIKFTAILCHFSRYYFILHLVFGNYFDCSLSKMGGASGSRDFDKGFFFIEVLDFWQRSVVS